MQQCRQTKLQQGFTLIIDDSGHRKRVFTAYTFILWHQLTGGFRRQWATKPLHTFVEALEAFRTAVEFRFVGWLNTHIDVFAAHKAKSGYVWA